MADHNRLIEKRTNLLLPLDPASSTAISENRTLYPSSEWVSSTQSEFNALDVTPRGPPASLPALGTKEGSLNKPHSQHMFHIQGLGKRKVCGVRSTSISMSPLQEFKAKSESQDVFTARYSFSARKPFRYPTIGKGIVPGTQLQPQKPERLLPAFSRNVSTYQAYKPRRIRKHIIQPVPDSNILNETSDKPIHWPLSVSSYAGQAFTTRKHVLGPKDCLQVKNFDGGARKVSPKRRISMHKTSPAC